MRACIVAELKKFAADLAAKQRWLILNKIDLLEPSEGASRGKEIVRRLRCKGPVFRISGATGAGTLELKQALMRYLDEHPRSAIEPRAEEPRLRRVRPICASARTCLVRRLLWRAALLR